MPVRKKKPYGNNFFADVYEVVKLVPKGRVTSYGAIAHYLGLRSGARMVGWALHGCPKGVPAHRVVNSAGLLTGKQNFRSPETMEKRLTREGVAVQGDKIQNFDEAFWDPSLEL